MYCSTCGTQAGPEARWCGQCGSVLQLPAAPPPGMRQPPAPGYQAPPYYNGQDYNGQAPYGAGTQYGAPFQQPPVQQAMLLNVQQPQIVLLKAPKNPGIAVVLSFFWCGLGQIYNGEIGKGVVLLAAHLISFLLMFVLIGFITTPILWIFGMVDAYQTAERLNRQAGFM